MLRGISARDEATTREDLSFESPVFTPPEYEALFAEAGFESRLFVGYEEREDDGAEPMLCFVCGVN